MNYRTSFSRKFFIMFNYTFLVSLSILCVYPIIQVFAISFSSSSAAAAGLVKLWPIDFNLTSYQFILQNHQFIDALIVTLERVALGVPISMFLTIITAYPLSKESRIFSFRTQYAWFYVFTILFNGGLIPWYIIIQYTGLIDTIWAMILPGAVQVFNIILLINFFRGLPKELEEAAFIDGASQWKTLWGIYISLSLPAIATLTLFTIVWNWNSWFDGLLLMNSPKHYPLSSYLQTIIIQRDYSHMTSQEAKMMAQISDRTIKSAQIFLGALPILMVYPFLQKFFVKGLVLGSVKE